MRHYDAQNEANENDRLIQWGTPAADMATLPWFAMISGVRIWSWLALCTCSEHTPLSFIMSITGGTTLKCFVS